MTTSRDLLELIADYVQARGREVAEPNELQGIAQRFDVALGEYILDRASMQNEG